MINQMKKDIDKAKIDAIEAQASAQNATYKTRENLKVISLY